MSITLKGHCAAAFSILVWGGTFVVTKNLLRAFSPTEVLVVRFALALVLLTPFAAGRFRFYGLKTELLIAAAGLSGISAYYLAENAALAATDAVNVGLIVTVIPLITAAFSQFFTKGERFTRVFAAAALVAGTGVVLVVVNGRALDLNPAGDLLALGAAVSFAVYSLVMKRVGSSVPPLVAVWRVFAWGLAGAAPFLLLDGSGGESLRRLADPQNAASFVFLAAIASVLCYLFWNYAGNVLGPVRTSVYVYSVPLVNTALSVAFLGETLTPLSIAGGILIVGGVAIYGFRDSRSGGA